MANEIFRRNVINKISAAIDQSISAGDVDHPGFQGRIREIAVNDLLKPFIPGDCDIGKGKVVDCQGNQSKEVDVVIYNRNILPSLLYSESEGIFPIESCIYAVEIKSTLRAADVRDAIEMAKSMESMRYVSGIYDEFDKPVQHTLKKAVPVLFAFDSDLSESGKSELERYGELDSEFKSNPAVRVICVVGRGYWYFSEHQKAWIMCPPTEAYDEVVDFLAGTLNTIPDTVISRGRPRFGNYLMAEGILLEKVL